MATKLGDAHTQCIPVPYDRPELVQTSICCRCWSSPLLMELEQHLLFLLQPIISCLGKNPQTPLSPTLLFSYAFSSFLICKPGHLGMFKPGDADKILLLHLRILPSHTCGLYFKSLGLSKQYNLLVTHRLWNQFSMGWLKCILTKTSNPCLHVSKKEITLHFLFPVGHNLLFSK